MRNFKELRVWQAAHELTLAVYRATSRFPREELYGLISQMRRASVSIGANLAEGCGRYSGGELNRFVQIARGSASELEYHLLLAHDLEFLVRDEYQALQQSLTSVRKMLMSLQQTLQSAAKAAGAGNGEFSQSLKTKNQ